MSDAAAEPGEGHGEEAVGHGEGSPPPRGSLGLLIDPVFGPYFAGKVLATSGIWIHNIVAAILAYEISGSAFVVGMVSVAQFGPQLLFAPMSGAVADRGDRRRQGVLGRCIAASGSGGLALWVSLTGVDGLPGAWPVILAAFVVGMGFVIGGPAMNALIPSLVRPNELAVAVSLNTMPFTVGRAGGPAVGALVAASAGPAVAFGLAALANLVFAGLILRLRIRPRPPRRLEADRRIRAGVRYLREDRSMLLLLIGVGAIGVGADPAITLTPALSASLGEGSTLVGVLASSFGIGAGLTFPVLGALRRRYGLPRLGVAGLGLLSLGAAAAGLSPSPSVAIIAFAVAGTGMTLALTNMSTMIQERVPEELRGRIMALWAVAFLGSRPIAAAVNGAVADATSPRVAHLAVAAFVAVIAVWVRPGRLSRASRS